MRDRRTTPVVYRLHPTRTGLSVAVMGVVAIVFGFLAPANATQGDEDGNHKVTICHRTNSVSNPYTQNSVDVASVDGGDDKGDHYAEHTGPVFDPLKDYQPPMKDDDWGDIIPPVPGEHEGLNWTAAGQAIWNNGCTVPVPTTSTSTSSTSTTSTSTSTTSTSSTSTSSTSTTSTSPTTSQPPVTTTSEPVTETPDTGATVPSTTTTVPVVTEEPPAEETPEAPATVAPAAPTRPAQPQVGAVQENAVPQAQTDGADLVGQGAGWTLLQSTLVGAGLLLLAAGGLLSVRRDRASG